MSDLLDTASLAARAEALLTAARQAGADAADVVAARDLSVSVSLRESQVETSESAQADDLGLRVFIGQRSAVVSTNDPREDLRALAERAVAFARLAPENPHAGLADRSLLAASFPDLDLLDPDIPPVARLEERARAAEAAMMAVSGVSKSGGVQAGCGVTGFVLLTSDGFKGEVIGSSHVLSATAIAGEGTGMERDHDYDHQAHATDLADPALIGRNAGERAARRLNPRKVKTGKVPVIYDWRAASSLVGHFLGAINGQAVARKTSFLRERMGQKLFRDGLSIVDDPLRLRGPRSRPFDGEGVRQAPLALINDGELTSWLLDSASAHELGLVSTGHASRGASGPPAPGATNVHMTAGSQSVEAMIKAVGTGLFVTDLIGQGVNAVTGDYSRGCSGFWIEGGELAYPVSEVTIAGNLIDMFAHLTPASDLHLRHAINAPSVLVEGLTLAGL